MPGSAGGSINDWCNKTALKRWMHTEIRCKRKDSFLGSPETELMLLPRSDKKADVEPLTGPSDSRAIGWKK